MSAKSFNSVESILCQVQVEDNSFHVFCISSKSVEFDLKFNSIEINI